MGYTHYWKRVEKLDKEKFRAATIDCRLICEKLGLDRIRHEFDSTDPPTFDTDAIQFNGRGDNGNETFVIDQTIGYKHPWGDDSEDGRPLYFEFCKTTRKPYDIHVCVCLVVLEHYLRGEFYVSSDGDINDPEEWGPAIAAVKETLGYGDDFRFRSTDPISV